MADIATTTTKTSTGAQTTSVQTVSATTASYTADSSDFDSGLPSLPNLQSSAKLYDAPTDKKRPSDAFIKSVNGYTLKIKHPWNFAGAANVGNESLGTYKTAVKHVKDAYGATIEEIGVFQDYNKILQGEISANKFEYKNEYKENQLTTSKNLRKSGGFCLDRYIMLSQPAFS